jgi:hypothetical protein
VRSGRELAQRLWPLAEVAGALRALRRRAPRRPRRAPGPQGAARPAGRCEFLPLALGMGVAYGRCSSIDPFLPARAAPRPWPGRAARDIVAKSRRLALLLREDGRRPALFSLSTTSSTRCAERSRASRRHLARPRRCSATRRRGGGRALQQVDGRNERTWGDREGAGRSGDRRGHRRPRARTREAVVRVKACGVCHTDLHYREGAINDEFPFLLATRRPAWSRRWGPRAATSPSATTWSWRGGRRAGRAARACVGVPGTASTAGTPRSP